MDANGANASEDGGGAGDNDTCLQLALEGEKLCKGGNCRDGVAFFEAALQVDDSNVLILNGLQNGRMFELQGRGRSDKRILKGFQNMPH